MQKDYSYYKQGGQAATAPNFNDAKKADSISPYYFRIKDGEEVIIRIMHDDVSTFDIADVHTIQLNGSFPDVNCIRNDNDSFDKCPLCKAGFQRKTKIFVHLIQYTVNPDGTVEGLPKVWARSITFADMLASFISDYGPLSNCLFKVKRKGSDKNTTYEIKYALPQNYPNEKFPVTQDFFVNSDGTPYKAVGRLVKNKSFDDLTYYLENSSFPIKTYAENQNKPASPQGQTFTPSYNNPKSTGYNNPQPQVTLSNNNNANETKIAVDEQPAWANNTAPAVDRPKRYY